MVGRRLWVSNSRATGGGGVPSPPLHYLSPFSGETTPGTPALLPAPPASPHPTLTLSGNHSESAGPAPSPSHSLEASGGKEEQLGREEPSRVRRGLD